MTSQLPNAVSFSSPLRSFQLPPSSHSPSVSPSSPLSLSSSPGLQTVQRFVYILLVEAGHVSMHVPVVVADVALCTPIGHRAKPEWWREFVRLLELGGGVGRVPEKKPHRENDRGVLVNKEKALSRIK